MFMDICQSAAHMNKLKRVFVGIRSCINLAQSVAGCHVQRCLLSNQTISQSVLHSCAIWPVCASRYTQNASPWQIFRRNRRRVSVPSPWQLLPRKNTTTVHLRRNVTNCCVKVMISWLPTCWCKNARAESAMSAYGTRGRSRDGRNNVVDS